MTAAMAPRSDNNNMLLLQMLQFTKRNTVDVYESRERYSCLFHIDPTHWHVGMSCQANEIDKNVRNLLSLVVVYININDLLRARMR